MNKSPTITESSIYVRTERRPSPTVATALEEEEFSAVHRSPATEVSPSLLQPSSSQATASSKKAELDILQHVPRVPPDVDARATKDDSGRPREGWGGNVDFSTVQTALQDLTGIGKNLHLPQWMSKHPRMTTSSVNKKGGSWICTQDAKQHKQEVVVNPWETETCLKCHHYRWKGMSMMTGVRLKDKSGEERFLTYPFPADWTTEKNEDSDRGPPMSETPTKKPTTTRQTRPRGLDDGSEPIVFQQVDSTGDADSPKVEQETTISEAPLTSGADPQAADSEHESEVDDVDYRTARARSRERRIALRYPDPDEPTLQAAFDAVEKHMKRKPSGINGLGKAQIDGHFEAIRRHPPGIQYEMLKSFAK